MKRIFTALVILCSIFAVSAYSLWQFYQLRQEALPLLHSMEQLCRQEQLRDAAEYAHEFEQIWQEHQDALIRFARRDPLEHMGKCAVRLPVLAEYGELAEFAATVEELQYCLDELWQSELPHFGQLF